MKIFDTYRKLGLFYFCGFLFFFGLRAYDGLLLSQLHDPFIKSPRLDPVLWLINAIGLNDLLLHNGVAVIYEVGLTVLTLVIIYRLYRGYSIQKWALAFAVLVFFYFPIVYTYPTLSIRKYLGFILFPWVFVCRRYWFWKGIEVFRYFVLFTFVSAALWKIFRGSVFHADQMIAILKAQHAQHFVDHIGSPTLSLISFLIEHPILAQSLFVGATIMQLSFVLGFFTKRYDIFLLGIMVLFIIADTYMMWIGFWEFLIFVPLFLLYKKQKVYDTP